MTPRITSAVLSSALLAAMLTGCASKPDATATADAGAGAGAAVCTRIYPVGSNLPTTRCVSAQQAAEEKRQMEQNPIHIPSNLKAGAGS